MRRRLILDLLALDAGGASVAAAVGDVEDAELDGAELSARPGDGVALGPALDEHDVKLSVLTFLLDG
jgi:hypothetical protein